MRRRRATGPGYSVRRGGVLLHAAAGFSLGLLAVITGFALAPAGDGAPRGDAAARAESAAAVRMALSPTSAPVPVIEAPPLQPQPFAREERALTPRGPTRIVVSSVGIDAPVNPVGYVFRDGRLQYDVPRLGAGHYVGTARPGAPGNAVIAGHVATRSGPAVFEELPRVMAGDVVEVYRGDERYRYRVTEIRVVAADATGVMGTTQDAMLTLITCFPDDGYEQRLVVVGKLI